MKESKVSKQSKIEQKVSYIFLSTFISFMLVTAGSALVPELAYPGAYIVCSNGTVQTDTKVEYPYSGKTVVSRNTICIKGNTSTSITLPAAIISFFLYATIFSLLFKFIPHRKE